MQTPEPISEPSKTSIVWAPLHVSPAGPRRAVLSRRQAEALAADCAGDAAEIQEREACRIEQVEIAELLDDIEAEFESERSPFHDYRTKTKVDPVMTPWMRLSEDEKSRVRARRRLRSIASASPRLRSLSEDRRAA